MGIFESDLRSYRQHGRQGYSFLVNNIKSIERLELLPDLKQLQLCGSLFYNSNESSGLDSLIIFYRASSPIYNDIEQVLLDKWLAPENLSVDMHNKGRQDEYKSINISLARSKFQIDISVYKHPIKKCIKNDSPNIRSLERMCVKYL